MRTWGPCTCAVAVVLGLAAGPVATASAATVALRVDTDGSKPTLACPPPSELRSRIRARLGYDPFDTRGDDAAQLAASVLFSTTESTLTADVEAHAFREELGRQRIVSPSGNCDELTTAVALVMSLVIEQFDVAHADEAAAEVGRPAERAPPAPAPPAATPSTPPNAERRTREESAGVAWASSAGVAAAIGAVPAVDARLDLRIIARRSSWSLGLGGRLYTPTTSTVSSGTVRADLVDVAGAFCGHRVFGHLCVVGSAGSLRGTGTSLSGVRSDTSLRLTLGVRAGVELRLSSVFAIQPYVEAALSPIRTSLYLGREPIWSSPLVQGALGVDWVTHFGAPSTPP